MEVVPHADAEEFARLARPLLDADPLRHTLTLTVLHSVLRRAFVPASMLTVHESGAVVGALLRTTGRRALVSGVPPRCAGTTVDALRRLDPDIGGAQGPLDEVQAFAEAWAARTGASVEVAVRLRLFALDELTPPDVPGAARAVAASDADRVDLLAAWRLAFSKEVEDTAPRPGTRDDVVHALDAGAGELVWEIDGEPVAQASARAVTAGMSRIGPVYTPPQHRCHGYAAAVTAAAAQWALDRGARHVLLYTDLANPTTNRLYPRLGFRPRYDALELRFGPPDGSVRRAGHPAGLPHGNG
jgi:GNAT superfamily N-acetyltransferase